MSRLLNHFRWSKWQSIGKQLDRYKKAQYEVFRKTNKNGLNRYKRVLIVKASRYASDAEVLEVIHE